jgi:hypothetical protein
MTTFSQASSPHEIFTRFPCDHSLVVGLPAKTIRTLAPGQLATMLGGAQNAMSRTAAASKPS